MTTVIAALVLTACQSSLKRESAPLALQRLSTNLHEFNGLYADGWEAVPRLAALKLHSDLWEHLTGHGGVRAQTGDVVRITAVASSELKATLIRGGKEVASVSVSVTRHADHLTLQASHDLKYHNPMLFAVDHSQRHLAVSADGSLVGLETKGGTAFVFLIPAGTSEGTSICQYRRVGG